MCAPHTARRIAEPAARTAALAAGKAFPVAPIVVTAARCAASPSAHSASSANAGAISEIPNGRPFAWNPAGTAIADRSSRFMKLV